MIAAVVAAATLTKPQYQVLLDRANARVTASESAAHRGLTPNASQVKIARLLDAMAATEAANARMFAVARPPAAAVAANRLLVRGERLFASEQRAFAARIKRAPSRSAAQRILSGPGPQLGPRLLDRAIAQLHALGYR